MTHSSYLSARCWLAQPEHSKSTQLIPWHIELPDISELESLFCMRTLLLLECWFWQVATWHNARIGYNDGIIINSEELTLTGSRGGRVWCCNNTALPDWRDQHQQGQCHVTPECRVSISLICGISPANWVMSTTRHTNNNNTQLTLRSHSGGNALPTHSPVSTLLSCLVKACKCCCW